MEKARAMVSLSEKLEARTLSVDRPLSGETESHARQESIGNPGSEQYFACVKLLNACEQERGAHLLITLQCVYPGV